MKRIAFLLIGLALLAVPVTAQTLLNNTTISAAVVKGQRTIPLTSAANVAVNDLIVFPGVKPEAARIVAINGTVMTVIRGVSGTADADHASSSRVFTGPEQRFQRVDPDTGGACTRANIQYLPWVNLQNGMVWTCNGGVTPNTWYGGMPTVFAYSSTPLSQFYSHAPDGVFAGMLSTVWHW